MGTCSTKTITIEPKPTLNKNIAKVDIKDNMDNELTFSDIILKPK